MKNEDQNFSLFNYVNEQQNEVEKLEEQLHQLQEEEQKFTQVCRRIIQQPFRCRICNVVPLRSEGSLIRPVWFSIATSAEVSYAHGSLIDAQHKRGRPWGIPHHCSFKQKYTSRRIRGAFHRPHLCGNNGDLVHV